MQNGRIMIYRATYYKSGLRIDDPIKMYIQYHDKRPKEQLKIDLDNLSLALYHKADYWVGSYGCRLRVIETKSDSEWGSLLLQNDPRHSEQDLSFVYKFLPCPVKDMKYSDLYAGPQMKTDIFFNTLMSVTKCPLDFEDPAGYSLHDCSSLILKLFIDSVEWVKSGEADLWFGDLFLTLLKISKEVQDQRQRDILNVAKKVYDANRDHLMNDYIPFVRR